MTPNPNQRVHYVTVSLTPAARDALRQIAITMSASCSRLIPLSAGVLVAAELVANQDSAHILTAAERAGVIDSHTTTSTQ